MTKRDYLRIHKGNLFKAIQSSNFTKNVKTNPLINAMYRGVLLLQNEISNSKVK